MIRPPRSRQTIRTYVGHIARRAKWTIDEAIECLPRDANEIFALAASLAVDARDIRDLALEFKRTIPNPAVEGLDGDGI
jgi:hypothetical protein